MDQLRAADPRTALALVRQGEQMYPRSPYAEEREARSIDALVALGDIGEAHSEAMRFVQRHPAGPFTTHIMNLMGVHPRPPGAVPEL
jgi:outer membrane protein assembly factor BamD (BamD/ComL family)